MKIQHIKTADDIRRGVAHLLGDQPVQFFLNDVATTAYFAPPGVEGGDTTIVVEANSTCYRTPADYAAEGAARAQPYGAGGGGSGGGGNSGDVQLRARTKRRYLAGSLDALADDPAYQAAYQRADKTEMDRLEAEMDRLSAARTQPHGAGGGGSGGIFCIRDTEGAGSPQTYGAGGGNSGEAPLRIRIRIGGDVAGASDAETTEPAGEGGPQDSEPKK